jgi:uncharacterized protein (TIGR03435 family)
MSVMKLPIAVLPALTVLCATLAAQSSPRFDVASIKSSAEQGTADAVGLRITGSQVRITSLSLRDYIAMAYSTRPAQVIVADWAAQERFDIAGNLPDGASRDQVPAMLQALLADRFQLKAHTEQREFPVYALTVSRNGLKITGTPVDPSAAPAAVEAGGGGGPNGLSLKVGQGTFSLANNKVDVQSMTMPELANILSRLTDRTVLDQTALTDRFTFSLDLSPQDYQAALIRAGLANGVVLPPQALRFLDTMPANVLGPYFEQTGLQLDGRRAPLDVIVVDSVAKEPTAN